MTLPLVGVTCCFKPVGKHPSHYAGDKYVRAVAEGAGVLPVLIPALGDWYDFDALADRLDGLLVTGSPSNVEPDRYGGPPARDGNDADPARDATTLPLIRAALAAGVPLLGICRGLQELNVALGGTLHQHVHEVEGRFDHRSPEEGRTLDEQYAPVHPAALTPDGWLARLLGRTETVVNSLHGQGVDRLAERLAVEAVAPDGQIEAVRVRDAGAFAIAFQWHPEWAARDNPDSVRIFAAFGEAVRQRAADRHLSVAAE